MRVRPGLNPEIPRMRAVGAIGTIRGAIGVSIRLEIIGFLVRAHGGR